MWTMFGHDMLLLCLLVWILIALEMRGRKPSYVRTAYQYHIWRENMDTVVGRLLFLIALIALREGVGRSTIAIATGIFTIQKIPCEPRETWITNQPPRPTDTTPPLNPA